MGECFICGGPLGLRGEQMILIEQADTVNSLKTLKDLKESWFKLVASSPTKGNQLSGSKFSTPLVGKTGSSG
eukprot:scaffold272471_cov63-Attheya_sp.AAC.1